VGLDWEKYVRVDPTLLRRSEQFPIIGNSAKLRQVVGRAPEVRFDTLLKTLLAHDLRDFGCAVPFADPVLNPELISGATHGPGRG
jgi:hypothetical protein